MKKNALMILGVLALMQVSSGEQVLSLDLDVYKNDSVVLHKMIVEKGLPSIYVEPGDYLLQITDESGKNISVTPIKVSFIVRSDPPSEMNPSMITLNIPYNKEMRVLKLYKGGKQIFLKKIDVCNGNGACQIGFETHLSCPGDCPLNQKDGVCIKDTDGICDPDCAQRVDQDCVQKGGVEQWLYGLLILVIVLVATLIIYKRRRK